MESERLTPRELDVLKLLAEGQRNREIADALGLAEPTVKIHVNNLLRKLRPRTAPEAAVIALKRGLIPPRSGACLRTRVRAVWRA